MELFLVQKFGDFDMLYTIAVCTEHHIAKRIIKNDAGEKIIPLDANELDFRKSNSTDIDYVIKKIKADKQL